MESQETLEEGVAATPQTELRTFVGGQIGTKVLAPFLKFLGSSDPQIAEHVRGKESVKFKSFAGSKNAVKVDEICKFIEDKSPPDESQVGYFKKLCNLAEPKILPQEVTERPPQVPSRVVFANAPSGDDARDFLFQAKWEEKFDAMISGKWHN